MSDGPTSPPWLLIRHISLLGRLHRDVCSSHASWPWHLKHLGNSSATKASLLQLHTVPRGFLPALNGSWKLWRKTHNPCSSVTFMAVNPGPHGQGGHCQLWLLAWDGPCHHEVTFAERVLVALSRNRKFLKSFLS